MGKNLREAQEATIQASTDGPVIAFAQESALDGADRSRWLLAGLPQQQTPDPLHPTHGAVAAHRALEMLAVGGICARETLVQHLSGTKMAMLIITALTQKFLVL